MIVIQNTKLVKIITFGFANGITLYPFIILKDKADPIDLNHEKIHIEQQKELLVIFFYLWYLIEWPFKGYQNISFEKEAYTNQYNKKYLTTRKLWAFWNYL